MQLVVLPFASCFLTVTPIITKLPVAQLQAGSSGSKMTENTSSTGDASSSSAALWSCAYIKENDIKLDLSSIASRKLHTGVVNGLRCRFCIVFGQEQRVGAKHKPPAVGQLWVAPFRYDNIESHMRSNIPQNGLSMKLSRSPGSLSQSPSCVSSKMIY